MRLIFINFLLFMATPALRAQVTTLFIDSLPGVSLRGLTVTPNGNAWVSGSKGTVGIYNHTAKKINWKKVPGFENTDFRDIHAWNDSSAVIMGIASPSFILKTTDAGTTWQTVFSDTAKAMFLDAMHFLDDNNGIVVGDPIDGKFFIATTQNGGNSWQTLSTEKRPTALLGEACFASSGSNIVLLNNRQEFVLVTGGIHSRIWYRDAFYKLPLQSGKESTGANSVTQMNQNEWLVVGGDFASPTRTDSTAALVTTGKNTIQKIALLPQNIGYKSSVAVKGKTLATAGFGASFIDSKNIEINGLHSMAWLANNEWIACGGKGKVVVFTNNKP